MVVVKENGTVQANNRGQRDRLKQWTSQKSQTKIQWSAESLVVVHSSVDASGDPPNGCACDVQLVPQRLQLGDTPNRRRKNQRSQASRRWTRLEVSASCRREEGSAVQEGIQH